MNKNLVLSALALGLVTATSCSKYDDSELRGEIAELSTRLTNVEEAIALLNNNVIALEDIVVDNTFVTQDDLLNELGRIQTELNILIQNSENATTEEINRIKNELNNLVFVRSASQSNGDVQLILGNNSGTVSQTFIIPAGRNGIDGVDGIDGINGTNGTNGIDGQDGADGQDGQDGQDGINGTNGTNGIDGTNGTNGVDGQNGADGQVVTVVSIVQNGMGLTFTFSNGQVITVPVDTSDTSDPVDADTGSGTTTGTIDTGSAQQVLESTGVTTFDFQLRTPYTLDVNDFISGINSNTMNVSWEENYGAGTSTSEGLTRESAGHGNGNDKTLTITVKDSVSDITLFEQVVTLQLGQSSTVTTQHPTMNSRAFTIQGNRIVMSLDTVIPNDLLGVQVFVQFGAISSTRGTIERLANGQYAITPNNQITVSNQIPANTRIQITRA